MTRRSFSTTLGDDSCWLFITIWLTSVIIFSHFVEAHGYLTNMRQLLLLPPPFPPQQQQPSLLLVPEQEHHQTSPGPSSTAGTRRRHRPLSPAHRTPSQEDIPSRQEGEVAAGYCRMVLLDSTNDDEMDDEQEDDAGYYHHDKMSSSLLSWYNHRGADEEDELYLSNMASAFLLTFHRLRRTTPKRPRRE